MTMAAKTSKQLDTVLGKWKSLQSLKWWDYEGDAPWWYNERASLSLFAGAVWRSGGWVFEEFSTKRRVPKGRSKYKRSSGRCDIMFGIGKERFIGEAKQCWPNLSRGIDTGLKEVKQLLEIALKLTSQLPADGFEKMAIVFVTPRIRQSKKKHIVKRIRQFTAQLRREEDVTLKSFFPKTGHRVRERGYIYPGVALLIKFSRINRRK